MDWKKHFAERPLLYEETDFFRQVEKTVSRPTDIGRVNSKHKSRTFATLWQITDQDLVLDMCCGNGIITAQIAQGCRHVTGVDYSEPLIRIAKRYNNPGNISYYCMSVLDPEAQDFPEAPFTKIYMSESLQHFSEDDLPQMLQLIMKVSNASTVVFFSGIPDIERLWHFYDTEERREEYRRRKNESREAIGTWWNRKSISDACRENGFDCEIRSQNELIHTAHYRFDIRLVRQAGVN